MSKGWVQLETIHSANWNEKSKKWEKFSKKEGIPQKKVDNVIRNQPKLTFLQLQADGEEAYKEKTAKEDALIAAYEDKRLKSKNLMREARRIIKARKAAAKKAQEEKEHPSTE